MKKNNHLPKLSLCLVRFKGKKCEPVSWSTSKKIEVLGNEHALFVHNSHLAQYVDREHALIYFEELHWYIKNTTSRYTLILDGQRLADGATQVLQHNMLIELGLCQIQIVDHNYVATTDELKKLLLLGGNDTGGVTLSDELLTNGVQSRQVGIGIDVTVEKTTFEDMGLGLHFDEQQFFDEIQSESAHIHTLQTTSKKESLDVLEQLAIESEIAIINPSLLNKNYWQENEKNRFIPERKLAELEHLFALKDNQAEYMVPLDNLERINDLLFNKDDIDSLMGALDDVDEYALFEDEQRVEPLRLFSMENHNIRDYAAYATPEFTQKEHHASSMDSYFDIPSSEKNSKTATKSKAKPVNNDWLTNFEASLSDKISADDILNSLNDDSKRK